MSRPGRWREVTGGGGPIAAVVALTLGIGTSAAAQIVRVSPGPLIKAHSQLEGVTNCSRCHEAGRISAERCLICHKPIADRIAGRKGVHRNVKGDCVTCHAEHAGADADPRRIDPRTFNHAAETGFPLEGRHGRIAQTCASCHKTRSFLKVGTTCSSCHADVHKGSLGIDCARCHSTAVAFKETRQQFDHSRARFVLTGGHQRVACEKCHGGGVFKGLRFDTCSACHREPHRKALGSSCTTCHTTERWTTRTIDHARTGFPLVGAHAKVECVKCHQAGITKPLRADQCSACHAPAHRASIKEDCKACHTEKTFGGAPFEHAPRTGFPLVGKHEGVPCQKCHAGLSVAGVPLARRVLDFTGARAECVSCHQDTHKGEYGQQCDACHRPATFKAANFEHPKDSDFYAGRHAQVACVKCHVRPGDVHPVRTGSGVVPKASAPSKDCNGCHADVHLGQVGTACDRCHAIDAAKFAATRFSHERAAFSLTGKHLTVECVKCHPSEQAVFPSGAGAAKRLKPLSRECGACHKDPHLGQVDTACSTCHSTSTFKVPVYAHADLGPVFSGFHSRVSCARCHKVETGQFPAGMGTALRLKVGRTCVACHRM